MKVITEFLNVFRTARLLIQAIRYLALILVFILVAKASWAVMTVAAVLLLALQLLDSYSKGEAMGITRLVELDILNSLGSVELIVQAVRYLALILVLALAPKASWLIMIGAAVFLLILQALFFYAGSDEEKLVIDIDDDGTI